MAIGSQTFPLPAGDAPFPVRQFTVEEYHQLAEAGVLTEDDRVELLEGWISPKRFAILSMTQLFSVFRIAWVRCCRRVGEFVYSRQ